MVVSYNTSTSPSPEVLAALISRNDVTSKLAIYIIVETSAYADPEI